jgi:hypothetical protein
VLRAGEGRAAEPAKTRDPAVTRDPTVMSPALSEALRPVAPKAQDPRGAAPAVARPAIPELVLKARLLVKDRPGVAVLAVDGRAVTVSPGSRAVVAGGATGLPLTLQVIKVDAAAVVVRVEELNVVLSVE